MIDLFGKDAQGTNKNMCRVDRDRVERESFLPCILLCSDF